MLERDHGQMTPELFVDQVATDWARRLGHRTSRATNVGRGYGRLELRDHSEPSLAVCACFTAIVTETLHRLGARYVEVNKTACEGVGDPACIYRVHLRRDLAVIALALRRARVSCASSVRLRSANRRQ
jgi:hypothetical protein